MIDRLHPLRILPIVMFILVSELSQKVNSEITHQWVRINHFLTSKTVEVDSDLKIPCSVEGYPIPIVDWYKDGELIQYNEQRQMIENQLVLSRTNISDSGFYTCHAYNSFSSDKQTVMVTIKGISVRHDEDKNINAKVIMWIALVQVIFLLLVCCLIHLLIIQRRKEEKLKELMNLKEATHHIYRTETFLR